MYAPSMPDDARVGDVSRDGDESAEPGGTWPAKRELASELRALLSCVAKSASSEEELQAAVISIRQLVGSLGAQTEDAEIETISDTEIQGMDDFMDRSPIVGLSNPMAPPAELKPDFEARVVRGRVTFGAQYEGAPGVVHGGYIAATFDEALGMATVFSGEPGLTGELTVRYRRPTPLLVPLAFEASYVRSEGRRIYTTGTVRVGDTVTAECDGLFIRVDRSKFAELKRAKQG